jgi:transcriptional regulator with XRE-family HTH domain
VGELSGIGGRLRQARERAGISQRELARRLGLSASMISQVESGLSKPSVSTLYGIVTELEVSLDEVFREDGYDGEIPRDPRGRGAAGPTTEGGGGPVVHPHDRHALDLDPGVRWERLTSHRHEDVDFLHVVYDVGGSSSSEDRLMRHPGREYGIVLSGRLGIQLGFERHELAAGDSIAFDSTLPHRLWNAGDEPVHGVWFVVGRDG